MKILQINHTFRDTDGQGKVNARLAQALLEAGNEVTLLGADIPTNLSSRANARVICCKPSARLPSTLLKNLSFGLQTALHLRRLRASHDLVIANGAMTFGRVELNICHFVHASWHQCVSNSRRSERGSRRAWAWYQHLYARQAITWERLAYRDANAIVAVSQLVKKQLITDLGVPESRIVVIENGNDEFAPAPLLLRSAKRLALGLGERQFAVLFAGDLLTRRKNFDVLLRALRSLPENVVLLAAGNFETGPYPAAVRQGNLGDRVRFLGLQQDMYSLYAAADLFALMSHYEPFGLVVTEALSAGLPVVTATTVGASSHVRRYDARIVLEDPDDAESLATSIQRLMNHAEVLQQSREGARRLCSDHTWSLIGQRYLELLTEIAGAN